MCKPGSLSECFLVRLKYLGMFRGLYGKNQRTLQAAFTESSLQSSLVFTWLPVMGLQHIKHVCLKYSIILIKGSNTAIFIVASLSFPVGGSF